MTERLISACLGVDNLEIVDEAIHYNAFLLALVTARARSDDIILDFAAGTGSLARPLAAQGCRVRCVDSDLRLRLVRAGLPVHAGVDEIRGVDVSTNGACGSGRIVSPSDVGMSSWTVKLIE
jgi:hypothetical protein